MRGTELLLSTLVAFAVSVEPVDPGMSVILVDLDSDGLVLTGEHYAVSVDADGDGVEERLTWTALEQRDGFLWLDRDGDGGLDAGELLAGRFPGEPSESAAIRLSSLDRSAAGGDQDGWLTSGDSAWPSVALWVDYDHDGRASSEEVSALADLRVRALCLDWQVLHHIDGSLNRHRRESVLFGAGPRPGEERELRIVEVILHRFD